MSLGTSPLGLVPLGLAEPAVSEGGGGSTEHNVLAAPATQANIGGTGAVTQVHALAASDSAQANTAGSGAVSQAHVLAASDSSQVNTGPGAAVGQEHNLAAAGSVQANTGEAAAVGQVHQLVASEGVQENIGEAAALTAPDTLNAAPGVQANIGGTGAIGQTHVLGASSGVQANVGESGAVSIASNPRYARPETTLAAGGWVPSEGANLAAMVAEPSADAATFIKATSAGACEIALNPVTDPQTSSGQVVRYQAWSPTGDALTVRLKQGAAVIASWAHAELPVEPTIFAQTLSAIECDSITNYADLRFEFVAG